jgi:hypothetical protein
MKNILYTFWTQPIINNKNLYSNIVYLLLSIELAKKYAKNIYIYTDNFGETVLKNFNLDINFNTNIVNNLQNLNILRWSIPKLYVIREQSEPFCHLDHDVFLWDNVFLNNNYQLIAQNIEYGGFFSKLYRKSFDRFINNNSTVPGELMNFISSESKDFGGFNCGYLDIYDIELSKKWVNFALNLNDCFIKNFTWNDCILIEQFSLYYLYKNYNLNIGTLLNLNKETVEIEMPENMKYTHLMKAKNDNNILQKVENNINKLNNNLYNKLIDHKQQLIIV